MRRYCNAVISEKRKETDDSIVVTLTVPADQRDHFRYVQGQHLPIRTQIDGANVRRTYSICKSVADNSLQLGIRIQEGGVFSNHLANSLSVGDELEIMPPSGRFYAELNDKHTKTYVAFVAGSGITPLLSIIKTTLETESKSQFFVFYGNRRRATTMFLEDLWSLKNIYKDRLSLHFIMSQEVTDIGLYNGRLDGSKLKALHDAFLKSTAPDDFFLCGPNPMIDELSTTLNELGYENDCIHTERFRPGLRGETVPRPKTVVVPKEGSEVTIVMDGQKQVFHRNPDAASILDAAQESGLDLPYSCKGGVCSTCRSKVCKGEVEMSVNYALEPWELERGFVLTCQARPKTREIELDFDQT